MKLIHEHIFARKRAAVGILLVAVPVLIVLPLLLEPFVFEPTPGFALSVLLALLITTALHEAVHGVVAWLGGFRPRFHFSLRLVYVTFAPGTRIPARRFRLIVAAPFALLTPLVLGLYLSGIFTTFAWFALVINVLGSAADLLMLVALRSFDRDCLVEDTATGFRVYRNGFGDEKRLADPGEPGAEGDFPDPATSGGPTALQMDQAP